MAVEEPLFAMRTESEDLKMSLVCHQHVSRSAMARCVGCGLLLCDDCRTEVQGRNHCTNCDPAPATPKSGRGISPWIAALLSVVPGLGQMACGKPFRSLVWLGGTVFLANAAARMSPAAPMLMALWFLNLCDAFSLARRARLANAAVAAPVAQQSGGQKKKCGGADKAFLGLVTIGVGLIFLLQNTAMPGLSVVIMWPIALALFGITVAFSRS